MTTQGRSSDISERHPIRPLFGDLARRGLGQMKIRDDDSVAYVADLMTRFLDMRDLYPFYGPGGERLEHLSDLVAEAHRASEPSVRIDRFRYLGDLSLFMLGLFPERFQRGRHAVAGEFYRMQGSSAYRRVASLVRGTAKPELFRSLAEEYDSYVGGLQWVRLYIREPFFQYMFQQFGIL